MRTRHEILTDVAEGRLSPEEAADLLDQPAGEQPGGEQPGGDRRTGGEDAPALRRVRVVGTFRLARIIGDPAVREAVVEGPHAARRDGDTLVIESELEDDELPWFAFTHSSFRWRGWSRDDEAALPFGGRPWNLGRRPAPLTVRLHPDLALDVELTAGSLQVERVAGPLRVDVSAGSARIEVQGGPLEVSVAAGSVRVAGVLDRGASRIRCEAGSVRVDLAPESSVRVRARAELGRILLPEQAGAPAWVAGGGAREATVGAGAATLDVEATMGSVEVSAAP
jgi:hypothetical protein